MEDLPLNSLVTFKARTLLILIMYMNDSVNVDKQSVVSS